MSKIKRWLAVPIDRLDGVRLVEIEGVGVDFFVKANDYDRLHSLCVRLIEADARGVLMSSDKSGTWNVLQEIKAEIGDAPREGASHE